MQKELARKARDVLKTLLSSEEKKGVKGRCHNPPPGPAVNFNFIKESIVPVVDGLGTSLRVELGYHPLFDPQNPSKFIILEEGKMQLCLSIGFEVDDFVRIAEIRKEDDFWTLSHRQGKEGRSAINSFGKMSRKDIILKTLSSVDSMFLDPAISNPIRHPLFSLAKAFMGKK